MLLWYCTIFDPNRSHATVPNTQIVHVTTHTRATQPIYTQHNHNTGKHCTLLFIINSTICRCSIQSMQKTGSIILMNMDSIVICFIIAFELYCNILIAATTIFIHCSIPSTRATLIIMESKRWQLDVIEFDYDCASVTYV